MLNTRFEKYIKDYELHCQRIEQSTFIDITESPLEKSKRIKKLEADYIAWFAYMFPMYATAPSAWFHKKMAKLIIENDIVSLLAEIYRSGAKSVHLTMGIPLFLYVTGKLHFMLLIGETEPKAQKLISDIQAQLQFNQKFINDYGRRYNFGDWSNGDFKTTDGVRFMSLGIGQNPRGVREGANRPDYIVVDDVDSKKRCNNDRLSREAYEWVWEDLQGTFGHGKKIRRFIAANNNFHKNTIINQLKTTFQTIIKKNKETGKPNRHFILSVSAVKNLETFEPNWVENTSAEFWKQTFDEYPYRSFMREFMHIHIQDGTVFRHDNIIYRQRLQYRQYDGLVLYGDLSYKDAGDYKALILIGKTERQYHILATYVRKSSRAMAAEWLYNLYESKELKKYPVHYFIEGLFAQDEFVNDFDLEGDKRGYHIPVQADRDAKGNKFDRIESMAGFFERKDISFAQELEDDPDVSILIEQLLAFEKGSGAADDGPDALQSGISKLNGVYHVAKFDNRIISRKDIFRNSKNRF